MTAQCHEAGAHAFLVVTPYYNKPPQRGIVAHFEAVARATDRPIVAYNIPSRVVINIEPETITRLAEIENVTAVKQANDDMAQARHIVETGLDLYAGDDNILQPFLELGGVGGICVHTHVVGPQVAEQVRAMRDGDVERAREIDRELGPAYDLLRVVAEPDRDQGRAEPPRPRGRDVSAAAGAADRRRARGDPQLPVAARAAGSRLSLPLKLRHGWHVVACIPHHHVQPPRSPF